MVTQVTKKAKKGNSFRAGDLMTDRVPTVHANATVGDVEKLLIEKTKQFESINYVYVLDDKNVLRGVISVKDIFREPKTMPVSRFMTKEIVTARAATDEEKVMYTALRHNIKAVPVVNKEGAFLGTVPNETIMDTLYGEMAEDLFAFAGLGRRRHRRGYDDVLHLSLGKSLLHRMPWLLIGLVGGIGIAQIVGIFQRLLEAHIILVTFIPLVAYMAAATATQTNAFILRNLALGLKISFVQYFLKELKNTAAIAILAALLLSLAIYFIDGSALLAAAVSSALFVAILSSIITGFLVPFVLSRFRLDPANATGPMATILQDAMSVSLYFVVVSLFF